MFKVNVSVVEKMTKMERIDAEHMYLGLAFLCEKDEKPSGSYAMKRSAESVVIQQYNFAERQLMSSYKELFRVSSAIYKRTGEKLIGFVDQKDKTPGNAYLAWRTVYRAIDDLKSREATA